MLDPPELELWRVISCHVGAGNGERVLWMRSPCSQLLSPLYSPALFKTNLLEFCEYETRSDVNRSCL